MNKITIRDLRNHGGRVVERVQAGEHLIVTRDGQAVAELRPVPPAAARCGHAARPVALVARASTHGDCARTSTSCWTRRCERARHPRHQRGHPAPRSSMTRRRCRPNRSSPPSRWPSCRSDHWWRATTSNARPGRRTCNRRNPISRPCPSTRPPPARSGAVASELRRTGRKTRARAYDRADRVGGHFAGSAPVHGQRGRLSGDKRAGFGGDRRPR